MHTQVSQILPTITFEVKKRIVVAVDWLLPSVDADDKIAYITTTHTLIVYFSLFLSAVYYNGPFPYAVTTILVVICGECISAVRTDEH